MIYTRYSVEEFRKLLVTAADWASLKNVSFGNEICCMCGAACGVSGLPGVL